MSHERKASTTMSFEHSFAEMNSLTTTLIDIKRIECAGFCASSRLRNQGYCAYNAFVYTFSRARRPGLRARARSPPSPRPGNPWLQGTRQQSVHQLELASSESVRACRPRSAAESCFSTSLSAARTRRRTQAPSGTSASAAAAVRDRRRSSAAPLTRQSHAVTPPPQCGHCH